MEEPSFFHQWEWDATCLPVPELPPADTSSPTILSFACANIYGHDATGPAAQHGAEQHVNLGHDTTDPARAPPTGPAAQNKDHVLTERKRREKLSEGFVALAQIVPGIKKMDKVSVLREAIKYLKTLQEQVKGLEDVARRRRVDAAVLVNKSQLTADENLEGTDTDTRLPEIEARMSDRTVLVKILCENRKGALIAALSELDSIGLTVISTNVFPFTTSSLDITIVATAANDFSLSVNDIVQKLNHAFNLSL